MRFKDDILVCRECCGAMSLKPTGMSEFASYYEWIKWSERAVARHSKQYIDKGCVCCKIKDERTYMINVANLREKEGIE